MKFANLLYKYMDISVTGKTPDTTNPLR